MTGRGVAWPTRTDAHGPFASRAAVCLDQATGLYHPEHFRITFLNELKRMDRTERPLGLIVAQLGQPAPEALKALGSFFKKTLRPLDQAAHLKDGEVAILLPETDRDQALALIESLGLEFEFNPLLQGRLVGLGAALARPYEDRAPEDLFVNARESLGPAAEAAARILSGAGPWAEADTALAAEEKDSLFLGFSRLSPGSAKSL
ncbi:MAG: hypothetical protein LBU12_02485 [Deltaproteobacteria bacterium]|jgi:hypothetical protein|nr:hypothetical protein [Deltaproteobacteria bacterium]